jgi:DNA-binding response OmpR family regulator
MLLRVNLELEGYSVVEAGNVAAIQAALTDNEVALLLLDVRLGDENGVEVARELRSERPEVAIAFLTGSAYGLEDAARAVSDHIIQKPFSLDVLIETVARLTRR